METAYVLRSSFFNNNELIRGETLKVSSEAELAFLGVRTFEAALHINFSDRKPIQMARVGHPIPSCLASTEHPTRIDRRPLFSVPRRIPDVGYLTAGCRVGGGALAR